MFSPWVQIKFPGVRALAHHHSPSNSTLKKTCTAFPPNSNRICSMRTYILGNYSGDPMSRRRHEGCSLEHLLNSGNTGRSCFLFCDIHSCLYLDQEITKSSAPLMPEGKSSRMPILRVCCRSRLQCCGEYSPRGDGTALRACGNAEHFPVREIFDFPCCGDDASPSHLCGASIVYDSREAPPFRGVVHC